MGKSLGLARIAGIPAALLMLAAVAHASDKVWDDCAGNDPARKIAACTAVLARGASESQQNRAYAHNNRGNGYKERGAYDRAIADYNEAIRLKPDYVFPYNGRGNAYKEKGEYDRAIADYNQAIRLNPDYAPAYNGRGNAYKAKGDYDRAIADYNKAVRLQPDYAFSYNGRGNAYNERGEYDRAIADYSEAIRLKPDYAYAYNGRGWAYNNKGQYDRAIPDLNQAIHLNPNLFEALNNRGISYKEKGDYDRAMADYNKAIHLKPDYAFAYNNRGNVYLDRGEYDRAIADYNEALRLRPNYSAALNNRVLAQRRRDEAQAALQARTARETQAGAQDAVPKPAPVAQTPQLANEKRVALVIGNSAYAHMPKLPNPRNDAQDLAKELETLGFGVRLGLDASRSQMEDLLVDFAREARRADTAVVFFAGHGLQHNGVNYLAPVDATLTDEADLRRFIRVQGVLEELQNARGVRILILDACRDNEAIQQLAANLPKSRSAAFTRGLAQEKASGVLIAFATQPNRVAQDGEGRNSPFTRALLKYLPTPGLELRTLLTRVRSEVLKETRGEQRPEVSDSLDGEFAFR